MNDALKSKEQLIRELQEMREKMAIYEPGLSSDNTSFFTTEQLETDQLLFTESLDIVQYLKESRTFSHLPEELLAELVPLSQISDFPPKTKILKEGEPNDRIFFLMRGTIGIYSGGEFIIGLKRKGDIFGEMSVISNKVCAATVLSETAVRVFSINANVVGKYTDIESSPLHSTLYRIFSMILTEKLSLTTHKAKQYEIEHKNLLQEIEHRKQIEKRLIIAQQESKIANKTKSEFMANMSHEFRTPLNTIDGFSDILSNLISDKDQLTYIDYIRAASRHLLSLIMDILELSKIESGQLEIVTSPVDLQTVFNEVEQIFKMKVLEKNIKLVQDFGDNPGLLMLDKSRMRQVLFNLVGNAIKFTENGEVRIKSDIYVNTTDSRYIDLQIEVQDTGIGISEADQRVIFEVFTQTDGKSTRKYGGIGLGLSICHKLTKLMNGEISLQSTIGKGSTFIIEFKNVRIADDFDFDGDICSFDLEQIAFFEPKILVADDVKTNRKLLETALSKKGCDVILASNGEQAISMIKTDKPDLVIMDIMMPKMDGFEAIKKIREDSETSKIPVLALTAFIDNNNKSKFIKRGFNTCLQKPINLKELINEMIKYLPFST